MSEHTYTMHVTASAQGMSTTAQARQHTIATSEPPELGGQDEAANPLETVLAALAGCEAVVAQIVAQESGFELQRIDFDVSGSIDLRGLQGEEGVAPYFSEVTLRARVETSESDARVRELQEATDRRCPVYTLLEAAGVPIDARWERAPQTAPV
jgi:uncharacterized OsmC-like protein